MPDIFQSVVGSSLTPGAFLLCIAVSLLLGGVIAAAYMKCSHYTQSFVVTLILLPSIVQTVIMLVNGNVGTGVAVAGTFSLVRFRSVPCNARDIGAIFLAMAVGLATGVGYLAMAALLGVLLSAVMVLLCRLNVGARGTGEKHLTVTIPENLDYTTLFDDLMQRYTSSSELVNVKTTNMGSLYKLEYEIVLRDAKKEKEMIDEIRCRNGNLEISCGRQRVHDQL